MRTLLALVLALWCGIVEAAIFNNDFTTNTFHSSTPVVVLDNAGIPLGLGTTRTNEYLMKRGTTSPGITFYSLRLYDSGRLMSIGYTSNAIPVLSGITNSDDVIGIGDFALDSLVGDGLLNIYGYGPSALAGTTLAPFSGQIFAYGESALSGANVTNATHIYAFGESAGTGITGDGPLDIYLLGRQTLGFATINNGSSEVYAIGNSAMDSSALDNFTGVYAIGNNVLNNAVLSDNSEITFIGAGAGASLEGSLSSTYAIGSSALANSKIDGSSQLYAFGQSALEASLITNSSRIYANGIDALRQAGIDNSDDIYGIGSSALKLAVITNASQFIFGMGSSAGQQSIMDGARRIYMLGDSAMSATTVTNGSSDITAVGKGAFQSSYIDGSSALYSFGSSAGASMLNVNASTDVMGVGTRIFENGTLVGSSGIYGFGSNAFSGVSIANLALTNSSDIYAFGAQAGSDFVGSNLTHIFMVGSGSRATNSNDYVFGDSAYNYFFPGPFATFAGAVKLSGNTNQYTDDGSTLLRNGVAIAGGDTTGTNVVTLTQTGTNVSSMNFALVQNGGLFKIALTNNAFMPTPSNVAAGRHAWLAVQQPSTGTCLVTWTNGTFNAPEGQLLINDTNNGAVVYYEMVSDAFTNGVVNLWMSTRMARMP